MTPGRRDHVHPHPATASTARVRIALVAILGLFALEIAGALRSGSLALLGDAGHLLADVAALGLAWYAIWQGGRRSTPRHTFGFHRTGILVAALNGAGLLIVAALIAWVAVARLRNGAAVEALPVVIIAATALVTNTGLALLLAGAGPGRELSLRSATLHIAADAVAAAGVLLSGALILATGWHPADALVSLAIAALIAAGAVTLLRDALHILAEATPRDIEAEAVRQAITRTPGVEDVHDLHIWSLDRHHRALSAHLTVADQPLAKVTDLLRRLETSLCADFGIEHATLQPECPSCAVAPLFCDISERHQSMHSHAG